MDDGKRDGWEGIGHAGMSSSGKSGMPTSSGSPVCPHCQACSHRDSRCEALKKRDVYEALKKRDG